MPQGRLSFDRAIRSVALGLAGVIGTFFTFGVSFPPHEVTLLWSLSLPLLAALAYGWRYGLLAGTVGGAAFMGFWLWPSNGWGNVVGSLLYAGWFVWHGWCSERRRERPAWWNNLYAAQIAASLVFSAGLLV